MARSWRKNRERRAQHSLTDAPAAALAKRNKAEPVTGDAELQAVDMEVKINWLA
jgi:predicted nucleic acid-binding protein